MSSSGGGSNSPHKIFEFSLGDRSSPKYESLKKVLIYLSNEKLPIGFFPASSMKTPFFWTVFTDFKLLYALEKIGIDAFPMLKRAPCLLFTNILYNSEKPDFARFLNVLQKSPNNVTKFGDVDFKNENIDISELVKEISNQNEKCIKFQIPLSEWLENRRDLVIHEVLSIIPQNYNFQSRQIISPEKFYLMNFRDHKNNQISLSINNKKHILNVLYFVGFPLASKDERWKIFNEYAQLPLFSFQSIKTFTAAVLKRCIKYGKLNAVDENELDLILKQHKSYPDLSTLSQYDLQMNKRFFNESLFEGNDDISFIPNHIFQLLYKQLRFFDRIRVIFATRSFNVDKKTFPVWEMSPPFWQQAYDILLFKYVNQAGLTYLSNFAKCFKSYLSKESALVLDKLNVYERSCYPIPPIDIKDSSISRDLSFLRNLNEVTKRLETLCDYFEANSNEIMAVENIISKNNSNIATNRQNINSNNRQSNYNFNEISISNNASTTHNHNNNLIFSIPNEYLDKFNPNDIYNKQLEIIQMHQMINSKNFTPAEYSRIWQRPTTSDPFYLMFSNLIGRQSIKKTCLILSDVNKYPIGLDEQGLP
ncbi:hypothetical protein TRFO_42967 [Tritrichomonas foetus]|uniref:Uncharacterized protein n=1 Tax=Tritrichomonas foetus TaxID=1144522 RepID=A0A1J4KXY0_9EUKA|nr:hypothetical protein TRFO_42967 [Tritrichomonas foetus]|eukprot:OHT14566.1 hypothetical protein TRFO_42967 [Tritrichomonas foetus]